MRAVYERLLIEAGDDDMLPIFRISTLNEEKITDQYNLWPSLRFQKNKHPLS